MKYGTLTLGEIEAIINKLGGLDGAQRFLREDPYFVDCDTPPFTPPTFEVGDHKRNGPFLWSASRVQLWQASFQQVPRPLPATGPRELYHLTKRRRTLNANVLDFLLENPSLIPSEWEGKGIVFWGTTYRRRHTNEYVVAVLYQGNGQWERSLHEIGAAWLDLRIMYSAEYVD